MKRIVSMVSVGLVMVAMMAAMAIPAFAAPHEFNPNPHSGGACGIGPVGAHEAIAAQISPGATEFALIPPSEIGCAGKG